MIICGDNHDNNLQCTFLGATMKSVPQKEQSEEDFFSNIKQSQSPILKNNKCNNKTTTSTASKENGYLTTLKNIPCLLVMLGNIPAIMGLYIPYMFLPGVRKLVTIIDTLNSLFR